MIGHAMADAPDDAGAAPGPGAPEYLRHVCHELRQPLVVAAGYVSMLDEGSFGELAPEVHDILRTVTERLDAANAIIDDLAAGANSAAAAPGQT
jgi:signal transduction histidine kinase